MLRGPDWRWSTQDDCSAVETANEGTVVGLGAGDDDPAADTAAAESGWVEVIWDSGVFNYYRMGGGGKFDLALAPSHDPAKLSTYHAIALQSLAMAKASSSHAQHQEFNNMVLFLI